MRAPKEVCSPFKRHHSLRLDLRSLSMYVVCQEDAEGGNSSRSTAVCKLSMQPQSPRQPASASLD